MEIGEIEKAIAEYCGKRPEIVACYLFGSYAKAQEGAQSDLDVLVEFDEGANLLDLVGLSMFLEEKLNLTVDVVPESAIRDEIRDSVQREKIAV